MIKAVIFDMDGTLLNTIISIKMCCDRTVERYGHSTIPIEKIREFIGDGAGTLVDRCLEYCGDTNSAHNKGAKEFYKTYSELHYNDSVSQFVGMYDAVRDIKETGIKIAALSNKSQKALEGNIYHFFGRDLFDIIVGAHEGFKRKPAPDEALKIAEELGVKPEECALVGDSLADMRCAEAAGMKKIAVLWGYRTKEELAEVKPDFYAEKREELPEIIAGLNK